MLSIERVSGLGVIEPLRSRSPVNHLEIFSVVIRMALCACRARRAGQWIRRMQALFLLNLRGDFFMALEAPERKTLRRYLMTLDAICRPSKALVRSGKRSWGYLRICSSSQKKSEAQNRGQALQSDT